MFSNIGVEEIDVHGMTKYQAKIYIDSKLKSAGKNCYRIRIIHGYHKGDELKKMIRKTYKNNPKVIRIEVGMNLGVTELVLKELF